MSRLDILTGHKGDQFFVVDLTFYKKSINKSEWVYSIMSVHYSKEAAESKLNKMTYKKENYE